MMEGVRARKGLYGFEFRDTDRRRAVEGERRTYDAKALWQRSHEIINLAAQGMKNTEIAKVLDIHPQTVSNTLNSELGEKKLSDIREDRDEDAKRVARRIRELTFKALDIYEEIFGAADESRKLKKETADTVALELAGLRAPTQIQSASFNLTATPEEIREFKERGMAAAKQSGFVIDAETEEVENG